MKDGKRGFWRSENGMLLILCLTFGFIMYDRFSLTYMLPFVVKDLKLSNTQIGAVLSAFSFAWALSGLFTCVLSDMRGGKKTFLAITLLAFAALSFTTGLVGGFLGLLIVRMVIAAFEGPVMPLAQSVLMAGSTPERRGLNMGIMQTTANGIIAALVGPVLLVALATAVTWRRTFYLTPVLGLLSVFLIMRFIKEPAAAPAGPQTRERIRLADVFRNRNILVSLAFGPFILCWYVVLLSFAPLYLTTVKGLSPAVMSIVLSALGIGTVVWGMLVPMVSDRIGRKPMIILASLLSVVAPLGLLLVPAGNVFLMALLAFVGWSGLGVYPLFMSIVPGESVHPKFVSTAISSIQAFGEIVGAVFGVMVAGILADSHGLGATLWLCAGCMVVATLVAFGYYETAPVVLARRTGQAGLAAGGRA